MLATGGIKTYGVLVLICCASVCGFCSQARKDLGRVCTEAEQKEAIDADSRDWKALYGLYKHLAHCDDGAGAENFSDIVVRFLARDWKHFRDLETLVASDRNFRRFVLNHIDATTDPDDLRAIVSNAHRRCPSTAKRLCGIVKSSAESALRDQASVPN